MRIVEIWPHGEEFSDRAPFEELYYRSFPENELRDLNDLMADRTGKVEFIAFYEDGTFIGFMTLLNTSRIVHIIHFAVCEEHRGRGCGSRALSAVWERSKGKRAIVDAEKLGQDAPNCGERERRINFYLKNGYRETDVFYSWRGENFVILSRGGNVTEADWEEFWKELEQVPNVDLF